MRRHQLTIVLALVAASCGAPTSPYYTPTQLPPDGLVASVRIVPPLEGSTDAVTITAVGDSVIASAILASGCIDYRAVAGQAAGTLVVTVVGSVSGGVCPMIASQGRFRTVVRPAPRGEYRVEYRARLVSPQQALVEWVLGRQSVRLP